MFSSLACYRSKRYWPVSLNTKCCLVKSFGNEKNRLSFSHIPHYIVTYLTIPVKFVIGVGFGRFGEDMKSHFS